jgi:hypothetical protein
MVYKVTTQLYRLMCETKFHIHTKPHSELWFCVFSHTNMKRSNRHCADLYVLAFSPVSPLGPHRQAGSVETSLVLLATTPF